MPVLKRGLMLVIFWLALAGCSNPPAAPATRFIDAGPDHAAASGRTVQLPGRAGQLDGETLELQWVQIEGPTVTLQNPRSAATRFIAPEVSDNTRLRFRLSGRYPDATTLNDEIAIIVHRPARNVLMLFTEDQGMQLGALGTPGLSTPHMDALAARGTLFTQAYITLATCTGAKSSIFTGLSNYTTGATGNVQEFIGSAAQLEAADPPWLRDRRSAYNRYRISDEATTLVERFRAAGFYTGLQNKFHLAPHDKFPYHQWYPEAADNHAQINAFLDQAQQARQPWFLVHVIGDPHRPYPNGDQRALAIDTRQIELPAHLPDTATARQDWAEYLQAIQDADVRLGRVMLALDERGQLADTVIVFLGDHGPAYHRGKFSTYDLGLRVPLILAGPGIPATTDRSSVISGLDIAPTLLEMLDLPALEKSHGISYYAAMMGAQEVALRREYAMGTVRTDRSITDGRYRLVFMPDRSATEIPADNRLFDPWRNRVYAHIVQNRDQPGFASAYRFLDLADASLRRFERPQFELYDTRQDPWEVDDLMGRPEHAATFERLRAALAAAQIATGDPVRRP